MKMTSMPHLFDNVERLFMEAKERTGVSRDRILLNCGIDPAQYRSYLRAGRLLSDAMLERLSQSEELRIKLTSLKGWRALDEYSPEDLLEAMKVAYPERFDSLEPVADAIVKEKTKKKPKGEQ
jgi:hypothetical protein